MDLAQVARGSGHRLRQLADREVQPPAHVQELQLPRRRLPALQGEHAVFAQIIHMQEVPKRRARSPAGHAWGVGLGRPVEAADQSWQHMAVGGVVVVPGPYRLVGSSAPVSSASSRLGCSANFG